MATRIIGYTLAVSAVFLWSLNYIYAKISPSFLQLSFRLCIVNNFSGQQTFRIHMIFTEVCSIHIDSDF